MNKGAKCRLSVCMLGEFSVLSGDESVSLGKISASKTMELFEMLMLYVKTGVPKSKIMQALYDWENVNDKNRSMNNLIYRLKQQLKEAGIVQDEYILIRDGICKWCSEIPTDVDTDRFEEALEEAQFAEDDEKLKLLLAAFSLYKGEFLPKMTGRAWVMEERVRLKKLYDSCVIQIAEILRDRELYEELYEVYSAAAKLYPFDEWQVGQIECLQKLERFEEAYKLYEDTIQNYFDELGLPLSQKMLNKIRCMSKKLRNRQGDVEAIREILTEGTRDQGAYYCTYPSFIDIYRYTSRRLERNGQSVFFMVCSVMYLNSSGRKSPNAGVTLYQAIESALRKGDVFSQYSKHQFLILLTGTQNENCEMIFERIRKNFKKKNRNSNCDLEYNAAAVMEFPEETKPLKFKMNTVSWN